MPDRIENCHCEMCRPITLTDMRMVLCTTCGNKRCPHAADHRNACTNSNEPGQPGSNYPLVNQADTVGSQTFQSRVQPWMMACFGAEISADRMERNHRFFEEATELVQACGMTASEAHQLVDYTYGRPVGERFQEVGGVMVTLAALCLANELNMHAAGEAELARIWTMVEKIRAKQAAKPKHSPLPEAAPAHDMLRFPTMLRKMWSGREVQEWLDANFPQLTGARAHEAGTTVAGHDVYGSLKAIQAVVDLRMKASAQTLPTSEPAAIVRENPDDHGTIIEATRPLDAGTKLYTHGSTLDANAKMLRERGLNYYAPDGTFMNADGTRSIFDDVDQ
jgi:hypothetical protein